MMAKSVIYRSSGQVEVIPSKLVTKLFPGDRVVIETAGGGGFGDPKERDRQAVLADVANGKVSKEMARSVYGLEEV